VSSVRSPRARARVWAEPPEPPLGVTRGDAVWGEASAQVTIVAFLDLDCPFSARAQPALWALMKRYGSERLRLVIKHVALPYHAQAKPAARFARAVLEVSGPEAYFRLVDAFYDRFSRSYGGSKLHEPETPARVATKLGLPVSAIEERSQDSAIDERIEADIALAARLDMETSPAMRVNGLKVVAADVATFVALVDEELRAVDALLARGLPREHVYAARSQANFHRSWSADEPRDSDTVWAVPVGSSPRRGPDDASVTLVEFGSWMDLQSEQCTKMMPVLERLLDRHAGRIRVVLRQAPMLGHRDAYRAAEAALEAQAQRGSDAYFKMVGKLQRSKLGGPDPLSNAVLEAHARSLGLDVARFRRALEEHVHARTIEADYEEAIRLRVTVTPTFTVGQYYLGGVQPQLRLERAIELPSSATTGGR